MGLFFEFMVISFEFLILVIVLASYFGIGEAFLKVLKIEDLDFKFKVLIGSAVYSICISLISPFLGIRHVTLTILLIGFIFCVRYIRNAGLKASYDRQYSLWVVFYMGASFLICFYPSSYLDPLNYHLYGVVEWAKLDKLVHIKSAIQLMHDSYGDYLYFPFTVFFEVTKIDDLVSLQVCSQLLTFILGIFTFSLILFDFFKSKMAKVWLPLLILSAITRASLQHKGLIAKNDWIALSWFFAGIALTFSDRKLNLKLILLASFLIGISVGAKFSYIFSAILAFVILAINTRPEERRYLVFSIITLTLTLTPYFMRNYTWTGNPIFPLGTKIFQTNHLGPSWIEGINFFDVNINSLSWEILKNKAIRIFTYEPVVYFIFFLIFFLKKLSSQLKIILFGLICFIVFFIFMLGPNSEMRHFGPFAIVLNLFGVYGLILLSEKLKLKETPKKMLVSFFVLIIFYNFLTLGDQLNPVPSAIRHGIFSPRVQTLINEKRGYVLSGKLLHVLKNGDRVALIDDTPPYYFSMHGIVRLWDDPDLDTDLNTCREMICILNILKKWNINYLIESGTKFDPYYRPGVLDAILRFKNAYPEIIELSADGENLISVEKLRKLVMK